MNMRRLKLLLIPLGAAAVLAGLAVAATAVADDRWTTLAQGCVAIGLGAGALVIGAPSEQYNNPAYMAWATVCTILLLGTIATGIWTFAARAQDAGQERRDADRTARTAAREHLIQTCVESGGSWVGGNCIMPNVNVGYPATTIKGDR